MEGEVKFCSKCGHPIRPVQMFCVGCGTRLQGQNSDKEPGFHVNTADPLVGSQMPTINSASAPTAPAPEIIANAQPNFESTTKASKIVKEQVVKTPKTTIKKKSDHKKLLLIIIPIIVAAILAGVVVFLVFFMKPKTRTSMIYMIGSDLESKSGLASRDLKEIAGATIGDDMNHKVLVYTGGASSWESSDVSSDENAIFELTGNSLKKVKVFERKVMTNADTLTEFLNYAADKYQATNYNLVLWDHGGGPVYGFGYDENSSTPTSMSISTLAQAISNSAISHLEMVGFDANLMSNIEVAKALSPYADYLLASEGTEPDNGWDYGYLSDIKPDDTPREYAQSIIEKYFKQYEYYQYDEDLDLALIDLKKVDDVISKIDSVADKVSTYLSNDNFSQYMRELKQERIFAYDGTSEHSYNLVDLSNLFVNLNESYNNEVQSLVASINNAIISRRSNSPDTNGLSIYFPMLNRRNISMDLRNYVNVQASDKYHGLLNKISNYIDGSQLVSRSIYPDLTASLNVNHPEDQKDAEYEINLELNDELLNSYDHSELYVYKKTGENSFIPVYNSKDLKLNGKMLTTTDTSSKIVLNIYRKSDDSYELLTPVAKEIYRTSEYVDYAISGFYYPKVNQILGDPSSFNLFVRFNKGEKTAKIIDSTATKNPETGLSSRLTLSMSEAGRLEFYNNTLEMFDGLGNRLQYPLYNDDSNTLVIDQIDGDTFTIERIDLIDEESKDDYYYELVVFDTQGYEHRLNLLQIERKDNDAV